jgi:hypothetical protein
MILDNAARADQIRPLLPTPESCLVIVTSRNRLSGLVHDGARSVEVDLLPPEKAIELLRERVGDRIDMDPSASAQLAKYCAYLPLTLHTAATHLGNEPDRSVAVQVGRLSDERRRLYRLGDCLLRPSGCFACWRCTRRVVEPLGCTPSPGWPVWATEAGSARLRSAY